MLSSLYVRVVGISARGIGQKYMTSARVGSPKFRALIKSEGLIIGGRSWASDTLSDCILVSFACQSFP